MKKPPLSRRDFLKISWTSLWGLILAACKIDTDEMPMATSTPTATNTATSTSTGTPIPTNTATQTNTPTETPTETPIPCFKLLTPEDGTTLENIGKVIFSWKAMQGAEKYVLEFTLPTGQPVNFETTETSITRYIESFTLGGEFLWQVTALDQLNNLICISTPFSFSKPASQAPKKDKGGDNENACSPWQPGCPINSGGNGPTQ